MPHPQSPHPPSPQPQPPDRPAPLDAGTSAAERLFALSHDLLCVVGRDGYCALANPAFERVLGWSSEALRGTSCLEYLHPEDRDDIAAAWGQLVGGAGIDALECRVRCVDGSYRWLAWRVTPPDEHDLLYAVGRDVTERRRADEALRRSEDLLRFVLDSGRMAVWDWDIAARRAYYGEGIGPLLGRPRGWQPTPDDDFPMRVHPDDREAFLARSMQAMAEGVPVSMQVRINLPDGELRWLLTYGEPQHDAESGAVTRFRGMVIDVTERVLLERQLLDAQKMEAVGQLAGGIAHDFNNLLTVITGFGDLAHEALPPDHPVRADVAEIRAAAARGAEIVRQLLAFGRRQTLRPAAVSLNDLLREREPVLARLLGEGRRVHLALAPEDPCARVDPGQLDQVLLNLVLNARDAMAQMPAGTLTLRSRRASVSEARAHGSREPAGLVALVVEDTGAGMDAVTRARVFEPFFTTKPLGAGSGLGLAMVHGIVAQSGGRITVCSTPGGGTAFTVLLPEASTAAPLDAPDAEQVARPAPRPGARAVTVLLAEDEDGVRRSLRRALERQGCTVLEARHGREALAVYERCEGAVDLLVTDVLMPEMGGPELVGALRAARPELPVVFMSGYSDDEARLREMTESGDGFLAKPFALDLLAQAVRDALATRSGG